jgi:hypothetical protein
MSTAREFNLVSIEDYLAGELAANVKHEYVAGVIYSMVGATNAHNIIATNLLGFAGNELTDDPRVELPFNGIYRDVEFPE